MPEHEPYPSTLPDGRPPHARPAPFTGLVGDYELLSELAAGGMGVVYKARQLSLNRVVALKMLLPGRLTSEVGRARFRVEAEATAELDHPNIVPIFEVGEHAGRPFFTMKLIDGGTLADLLRRSPRPPLRDLVGAVAKVCRAVHFAHQRGILHRDLKPGNVLIDAAGEPFVADFGLAKRVGADDALTATGAILGTPAYMAPEQAGDTAHGVTTLTDVYALGAILYEVLTGRPPFAAPDIGTLLAQIRGDAPAAPSTFGGDVPRDLELVCLKCLAKVPTDRYAAAGDVADELDRWLRGEPVEVRAPGLVSRLVLWARRNSRAAVWAALIGTAWGLFGLQLPIAVRALLEPARRVGTTLSWEHDAPPVAGAEGAGSYLWLVLLPVGLFVHFSGGMATYLATRSGDRWSVVGSGFAVGLIGGVISFTLYIGPVFVILTTLVPVSTDLQNLGGAASAQAGSQHWDEILARSPDLARVPEHTRGRRFAAVVRARIFVGIFEGVALGMLVTLVTTTPLAVGGAVAADFAVRRAGSARAALPLYLEICAVLSLVVVTLVVVIVCVSLDWRSHTLTLALWLLVVTLTVFGALGVMNRWGQRERWAAYWLGFGAVALATELQADQYWPVLLLATGCGNSAALLWRFRRHRGAERGRSAATAPKASNDTAPTRTLTPERPTRTEA